MIELRPYQRPAVEWLTTKKRGLIKASAGSGKTVVAAAALALVVLKIPRKRKVRVGWIANTLEQINQAEAAISKFPAILPFIDVKICCAAAKPDMRDRDILIVDEAHHAGSSPLWISIIEPTQCARWFFSATPWCDDEVKNEKLMDLCGGNVFEIERSEIGKGLADAHVVMLNDTDPCEKQIRDAITAELHRSRFMLKFISEGELFARTAFRICMDLGIVQNKSRNNAIIRTALKHKNDSVIIIVNKIEHGAFLAEKIPDSVLFFSKMGRKKRVWAMEAFKNGTLRCLIGTSILDEGFDCPRANVLILACAGKSSARAEQRTGRVLRSFAEKTHGTIYDFTDTQHPVLRNQSLKRVRLYQSLGYILQNQEPKLI